MEASALSLEVSFMWKLSLLSGPRGDGAIASDAHLKELEFKKFDKSGGKF